MNPAIKILIAEHDKHDREMIVNQLKKSGINYIIECVEKEPAYREALKYFIPDAILCDYTFPSFDGPTAFEIRENVAPETPFILVSGTIGEENSIELIKNGVTDFVLKDKIFSLDTKLARALKEADERKEKNKTEKELKEVAAHLAEAQKLAKLGSWDYDITTDRLIWSEQLYKVFEADKKSFTGTHGSFIHLIDEADRNHVEGINRQTQKTGEAFVITYSITTPKGEKRVIQEHGYGLKDKAGKVVRLFGTAQDITETYKAAASIKKAYDEKNAVLESIDDGFFATDKNGQVTYWNRKAEILLQVKREDIVGKNVHEMFADKKSAIFYNNYQKAVRENSTVHFEGFSSRTEKWFAVSAFGSKTGMSVYFKDVTERKRDEEKLRESELRYRQIVETAQEGIWLIDENSKTTFVNKKMSEILEYAPEEMMGKPNSFFMDDEWVKKTSPHIQSRKLGMSENYNVKYLTKSGKEVWTNISTNPLFDDEGRYKGALAMATDITERKRAEQEMDWLINNTEESFLLLNAELEILSFNKQSRELYVRHFGAALIHGHSILDYAPQKTRTRLKQIYTRVLEGFEESKEIAIPSTDGITKVFLLKYKPAKDEHGKIIGVFVSATDVTEKRKSEQQLITQEKRYRALVENSADAVVIISAEGKLQYASPTVEKILGYKEEEILTLNIFSLVYPDDALAVAKVWKKVLAKPGISFAFHTRRMLHKNGSWRWLEATVTNMLNEPALNGVVYNFRDVTTKKELEDLLSKTNSLARIGSWEMDIKKNTLYWSDITKEIHETEAGFIPDLQTAINFYKEGESRNLITQKVQDALEKGLAFDAELQIITAKGNEKWIRAIGETEFANGKAEKIGGSFQDITDRKLYEIRLNELNEKSNKHAKELAISNAELEQFAYVASHDLQEPLRMVTSFLTQLEKKYGTIIDDRGKQYIEFAVDGAKRMRQIILDLLEFSRVGKTEGEHDMIDLNDLVDEIKILCRKQIQDKRAVIISDSLPQVPGYRSPLRQVFQNLIGNALKFVAKDREAQININCIEFNDHWQFAVRDNGIGIDKDYFDKIFIIFQRLHNKSEFPGTGMGLAVTKKIIENGGGRIWVESEEGKGSTFYFTIKKTAA